MLAAPHRPRLRAGPTAPLRFDRTQLPPGYFLFSDFGAAKIDEQYGKRPITQSGAVPFGASQAGVGINWGGGGATSRIDYATFAIPAQFTMEALVQIGTVQNENVLTFLNNNGADTGTFDRQLALRSTGVFQFYVFTGAINYITGTTTFAAGDIVHISVTYDGTTYRLYTNGVLDGSSALGAAYGGYTNPVLSAGFQNVSTGGGGSTTNQSTHTLLLAGMADRALSANEALLRSLRPWAPLVGPGGWLAANTLPSLSATITGTVDITASATAVVALAATVTGTVDITASATAALDLAATIGGTVDITAQITAMLDGGTDTHDGFIKRTRRERRIEAMRAQAETERLADAVALRLSLEAAMGMAAEVVEDEPEAVQEAVQTAAQVVPMLERPTITAAMLAEARAAFTALHVAMEDAARARALAEDDEEIEMLLRAL